MFFIANGRTTVGLALLRLLNFPRVPSHLQPPLTRLLCHLGSSVATLDLYYSGLRRVMQQSIYLSQETLSGVPANTGVASNMAIANRSYEGEGLKIVDTDVH